MDWKNLKLFGAGAAIAGAAVLAGASPAWAAGAGVTTGGSSTITGNGDPEAPLCLPASAVKITLSNMGTFNGSATSVGTTAEFTARDTFFYGPEGTFADSLCTSPTEVVGSLKVTGGGGCDSTAGGATYQRVTNAYVIKTTTGTCGVLTFEGNQNPCLPGPADPCGPNGQQEFTGTYTQA